MPDRLTPLDVSFLSMEDATTPMHVGTVAVFEGAGALDQDRLTEVIGARTAAAPRYRQRVRWLPVPVANPVWVDDPAFDLTHHVRRTVLPRPGTDAQLRELVARQMSRPLDRDRPLWEVHLVDGLGGDRFALATLTHQAMVDGVGGVEVGELILDTDPNAETPPAPPWTPRPEPSRSELVGEAVAETVRRPSVAVEGVLGALGDVRSLAERGLSVAGGLLSVAATAVRPAPDSPLGGQGGGGRRYATAVTELEDYRRIRKSQERRQDTTVNDVVLAVVAGALREWLLMRGEPLPPHRTVRALVPVSVRDQPGDRGNHVSAYLVDLPVGEASPVMRLHQVSYAMRAHKESGQAVGARTIVTLAGFAPTTLHSLASRAANGLSRRLFNLVVANVPGPQAPLYAAGSQLGEVYPVVPLAKGQAVTVGLTSYHGSVYFGLNADRDLLPEVDLFAEAIVDALGELVGAAR